MSFLRVLFVQKIPDIPDRAFSLLLGIPEKEHSGVFIAKTPIDAEALHYSYRENL